MLCSSLIAGERQWKAGGVVLASEQFPFKHPHVARKDNIKMLQGWDRKQELCEVKLKYAVEKA